MNTFFFPLKKKWSDLAPNVLRYSVWSIILSFAHFNPLINVFSIISSFPTHCPNVSSIWRLKKNYYLYLLVPVLSLFSSDDLLQNSRRKLEKYTRLFSHLLFHLYIKINVTINDLLYKRIYIGHETETVTLSLGCHARKKNTRNT